MRRRASVRVAKTEDRGTKKTPTRRLGERERGKKQSIGGGEASGGKGVELRGER